jgi:hypothetical protein
MNKIAPAILAFALTAHNAAAQFASTSKMLGTITSTNQSLWSSRQQLERTIKDGERYASSGSNQSNPAPTPGAPAFRYPIMATDFHGARWREVPEQWASMMSNATPEQQSIQRRFYHQLLDSYETVNRRNNVAAAVAYSIGSSLEINRGQALTQGEINYLVAYVNEALASSPQFLAMTAQQKQVLYESAVVNGGIVRSLYVNGKTTNDPQMMRQAGELSQMILGQWAGR